LVAHHRRGENSPRGLLFAYQRGKLGRANPVEYLHHAYRFGSGVSLTQVGVGPATCLSSQE
jgi:hypothetical protein